MKRPGQPKSTWKRRGVVIALTSICLITLLLCAALAIDVGYICALTTEQQNNADAGALAGASGLQDQDSTAARSRALSLLAQNQEPQGYRSLSDQIIDFGWFDSVNLVFHPLDDPTDAFAIRVRAARNNVDLFFAPLMGINTTDVWREAVAIGTKPCGGIWGLEGVRIPGNVLTDSYDSTGGPYVAATAGEEGDVCSGRGIRVMGSIEVHGDVMAGLGYMVDSRGGPIITGVTSATLDGVEPPPIDFGDIESVNDNGAIPTTDGGASPFSSGWNLRIGDGDNLTLPPGEYYFDSVTMNGAATLTLTGPTTIYVNGDFNQTGEGIVNTTMDPHDLTIYSMGKSVKINGEVDFYGTIVAPYAEVNVGGSANFYGALVGLTVRMYGDFNIHVDESLEWAQPWFEPPNPFLVK